MFMCFGSSRESVQRQVQVLGVCVDLEGLPTRLPGDADGAGPLRGARAQNEQPREIQPRPSRPSMGSPVPLPAAVCHCGCPKESPTSLRPPGNLGRQ